MTDKHTITRAEGLKRHFRDMGNGDYLERVVAGITGTPGATFARPNDAIAYAIGDLVANDTVAVNVAAMPVAVGAGGRSLQMLRARLVKSDASVANAAFRVHLYSAAPALAGGDNAAFSSDGAANYLGSFDIAAMMAFTDGAVGIGVPLVGSTIGAELAGDDVFALIEARGAYVPVALEQFTLSIEAVQD